MNRSEMSLFARALYAVAKTLVTWWIALLHPQRVQGREHLPADGSFIIIANHRSMLDVFFIARLLLPRRTVFMAKEELFGNVFMRWLVGVGGGFPVKRGSADISAIKKSLAVLREERQVFGIFPEGTRNKNIENGLQKFYNGVGYIALMAKVPVVPIFFADMENFRPFRCVQISIGQPVVLNDLTEGRKLTGEATQQATDRIFEALNLLRQDRISAATAE